jgi:hypothetical protein
MQAKYKCVQQRKAVELNYVHLNMKKKKKKKKKKRNISVVNSRTNMTKDAQNYAC